MRVHAVHLLNEPPFFSLIFAIYKKLLDDRMKKKVKVILLELVIWKINKCVFSYDYYIIINCIIYSYYVTKEIMECKEN